MGQEISDSQFDAADFDEFRRRLDAETTLLKQWFDSGLLASAPRRVGFEIEGWLIDAHCRPAPNNDAFLAAVDDALVVPELARFNFELNSSPCALAPGALDEMHAALHARWMRCQSAARSMDLRALMIGILPTVRATDLNLDNMTPLQRYRAINDQVLRLRDGEPIVIDIDGSEHLLHRHPDVMLEAATTSLQIHVQVGSAEAARAFNLCKMLSAITVGVSANSPFLFGHRLWQETRVPLFEQAVAVGGSDYSKRVTFGIRYARDSVFECFDANLARYPIILPDLMDEPRERLAHLRLHNGTVWRWNRPLIGFDASGQPHCRIEHRVAAAGPTPSDVIANMALFLGLFEALMDSSQMLERALPFERARDNFYRAARDGLRAEIVWMDGRPRTLKALLESELIEQAEAGLKRAGLPGDEARRWLAPIRGRVQSHMTAADWQLAWIERHGRDLSALVDAYTAAQSTDTPLYQWSSV